MYNRYIPQPDGSFRRSRVEEPSAPQKPSPPPPPPEDPPCPPPPPPKAAEPNKNSHYPPQARGAGDFLRQLLPKNLDTGDLMIILLLLLMAGDCQEDRNTALLTLAIYLFM